MAAGLAVAAIVVGASAPPATAARAVREDVEVLQRDLQDLEQRLVQMQEAQAAERTTLEGRIQELRDELALDQPGRRSPADLAARLDSVENDVRIVYEKQNEMSQRLAMLADRVEALWRQRAQMDAQPVAPTDPSAPGAGEPPPLDPTLVEEESVGSRAGEASREPGPARPGGMPEPLVDPEELYQSARADYSRGSFDLAIAGFREFLDRFPDSQLAPNALYWIGESQYSKGDYEAAVASFDAVVTDHARSDKASDAAYKKGLALLELQRTPEATLQLQRVRDRYPDTPAAVLARQKLQELGQL